MNRTEPVHPDIATARTQLVVMPEDFMQASLAQNREEAEKILGVSIPAEWPDESDLYMLRIRLQDVAEHPDWAPWLLRAIVDKERTNMLGYVNFHSRPNKEGIAEIGYTIFSEHRRRGFAEEAVRAMFAWAVEQGEVEKFRASVSPSNEPSLRMVEKLGFSLVGQQWDEVDGLELVFELRAGSPNPA